MISPTIAVLGVFHIVQSPGVIAALNPYYAFSFMRAHLLQAYVVLGSVVLVLTGAEFMLLLALAQRTGELVDKASLTRIALGRELERFDRSIDVHVSRLRHKLAEASEHAPRIESVRGSGYLMIAGAP